MALTSAALRGVDVRVLVPRRSDSRIVSAAARSYFDELIVAGVKVWEYKARMLHSKTLVVDDNCAMALRWPGRWRRSLKPICAALSRCMHTARSAFCSGWLTPAHGSFRPCFKRSVTLS